MAAQHYDIVIVGGGLAGILVATNLLKYNPQALRIKIFETAEDNFAKGVAYSTTCMQHLLNVPNKHMSLFPEDRDHFITWLAARQYSCADFEFSPRVIYAEYISATFNECLRARAEHNNNIQIDIEYTEITAIRNVANNWQLFTGSKHHTNATRIILALGVPVINSPWSIDLTKISNTGSVAIIGSGLTAVDMLLLLNDIKWQGKIDVYSRSGRLPLSHDLLSYAKPMQHSWFDESLSLFALLKLFRLKLAEYLQEGYTWQAVFDSMRPYHQKFWQKFSLREKQQFKRHLRSLWSLHRHRIAPSIADKITKMQDDKFFAVYTQAVADLGAIRAEYDVVLDCRGLTNNLQQAGNKLWSSLFQDNIVQPGPLNQAIMVDGTGEIAPGLYTLGYARSAVLGESIAVPEIRQQAHELAKIPV